jgi:hypothetical protein
MEEAAALRRAVLDAVRDVVPGSLHEEVTTFVENGSSLPGVLTLLAAEGFGEGADELLEQAVGVQLIYDGLRLTRDLVHEDPWAGNRKDEGDMAVLAADVMVARGFYLLSRTAAAGAAVEVVRAFGRDQTDRRERADPTLDANLERDTLELAVLAGATAVGADPPDADGFAADLAEGASLPGPEGVADRLREQLRTLADGGPGRPVRTD